LDIAGRRNGCCGGPCCYLVGSAGNPRTGVVMIKTDKFVVGFAFSKTSNKYLLVEKLRPKWQEGCLNGIGGKIEPGELPMDAMDRECLEETGLILSPWTPRGVMKSTNNDSNEFKCYIYYVETDLIFGFKQLEDEKLGLYTMETALSKPHVANLEYLLPFGMCSDRRSFIEIMY
jgi:8-oxo-dGTP diphosphatase